MHVKPGMKQQQGKKHPPIHKPLNNRTVHEFSVAPSSWHGPSKNVKVGKEKVATNMRYVGSCGSPCNYTGQLHSLWYQTLVIKLE